MNAGGVGMTRPAFFSIPCSLANPGVALLMRLCPAKQTVLGYGVPAGPRLGGAVRMVRMVWRSSGENWLWNSGEFMRCSRW